MAHVTITFGHGSRHLGGHGLLTEIVEAAIEADIRGSELPNAAPGSFSVRTIEVEGIPVEYHAYVVDDERIHVGTYFVPR
jgi:hypothetical protein